MGADNKYKYTEQQVLSFMREFLKVTPHLLDIHKINTKQGYKENFVIGLMPVAAEELGVSCKLIQLLFENSVYVKEYELKPDEIFSGYNSSQQDELFIVIKGENILQLSNIIKATKASLNSRDLDSLVRQLFQELNFSPEPKSQECYYIPTDLDFAFGENALPRSVSGYTAG